MNSSSITMSIFYRFNITIMEEMAASAPIPRTVARPCTRERAATLRVTKIKLKPELITSVIGTAAVTTRLDKNIATPVMSAAGKRPITCERLG